ncbi:divergent protein kinase domain 1C-like isoform X1 [Argiope bruennichi]|uniref:divergent protein kinase domain 1C-like isoform X1 n=1 Tax=Argiope bruennichi TaxID=94029 RepID=UPI0024940ABF|nr:divergent protein kinase domain 1C-like isoform X1 [Argiope bruennichi]
MAIVFSYRFLDRILYRIRYFICRWILRRRPICFLLILIIFLIIFTAYMTIISYSQCSFLEVENAVHTICDKYQNQEALGNLCADLCESNNLKPNSCLPNHLGKDVVFQATYFGNHVVMKSSKLNSEDFDQIYYINEEGIKVHPSIATFYSMIANTVQSELHVNISSLNDKSLEVLSKLWTRNLKKFSLLPTTVQNVAMSNIWFLVQQTEYLLMKYYEDLNIFPKILGTCGPFYVVEFIQPLNNFFIMFYPSWKEDFIERAALALKILNFLEETERHFPFLHFCDVKVGHFGLNKNGEVKLLDMDMVFFEESLIRNINAIQNCTKNQDCSFIDCQGSCDIVSKTCEAKVIDNNFQRVCRNILTGKLVKSYFGLLSSPPRSIYKELYNLLKECSEVLDDKSAHILASHLKNLLVLYVQKGLTY